MCDTCSDPEKHELEREVGRLREDLLVLRDMLDARAAEVTRLWTERMTMSLDVPPFPEEIDHAIKELHQVIDQKDDLIGDLVSEVERMRAVVKLAASRPFRDPDDPEPSKWEEHVRTAARRALGVNQFEPGHVLLEEYDRTTSEDEAK